MTTQITFSDGKLFVDGRQIVTLICRGGDAIPIIGDVVIVTDQGIGINQAQPIQNLFGGKNTISGAVVTAGNLTLGDMVINAVSQHQAVHTGTGDNIAGNKVVNVQQITSAIFE